MPSENENEIQKLNAEISARVRELREQQGLTFRALADRARLLGYSMSASRISDLEKGTRTWGLTSLCAIAASMNVTPGDLIKTGEKISLTFEEESLISSWRLAGPSGVLGWVSKHLPSTPLSG